ncbi:MAG: universal stress protein [Thermoplasmata archaeon]
MYDRLLLPVRSPSEVEPIIRFAAGLLNSDGELRTLHVIPTITMPEVTREWRASVNLVVPAHETGAALDVRVEPEIRASVDVPGEILESAESHDVGAILLTLGGDRRSRNPFVGHTASSILHHARADVIVVNRLALTTGRVPRVLLPTIRGPPSPKVLKLAEQLSIRQQVAPIVTVAIGPRDGLRRPRQADERTTRGIPLTHKHSFASKTILGRRHRLAELILTEAAAQRYGLLVLGEEPASVEGPPLLTRPFLEELFRAAPCPVVAIRG